MERKRDGTFAIHIWQRQADPFANVSQRLTTLEGCSVVKVEPTTLTQINTELNRIKQEDTTVTAEPITLAQLQVQLQKAVQLKDCVWFQIHLNSIVACEEKNLLHQNLCKFEDFNVDLTSVSDVYS